MSGRARGGLRRSARPACYASFRRRNRRRSAEPQISASLTGSYYAMRDERRFRRRRCSGESGIASFRGALQLRGARRGVAFIGWKWAGGETVTYEITPIAGILFGDGRAAIPGLEASVAYRGIRRLHRGRVRDRSGTTRGQLLLCLVGAGLEAAGMAAARARRLSAPVSSTMAGTFSAGVRPIDVSATYGRGIRVQPGGGEPVCGRFDREESFL